jgi:hypothetical protein
MNMTDIKVYKVTFQCFCDVVARYWVIDARHFDQPIGSHLIDLKYTNNFDS